MVALSFLNRAGTGALNRAGTGACPYGTACIWILFDFDNFVNMVWHDNKSMDIKSDIKNRFVSHHLCIVS